MSQIYIGIVDKACNGGAYGFMREHIVKADGSPHDLDLEGHDSKGNPKAVYVGNKALGQLIVKGMELVFEVDGTKAINVTVRASSVVEDVASEKPRGQDEDIAVLPAFVRQPIKVTPATVVDEIEPTGADKAQPPAKIVASTISAHQNPPAARTDAEETRERLRVIRILLWDATLVLARALGTAIGWSLKTGKQLHIAYQERRKTAA